MLRSLVGAEMCIRDSVTREWYPYDTQKNIELRTTPTYSSNNLDGTIIAGTELQIDLLHVTKAVVNSKTY